MVRWGGASNPEPQKKEWQAGPMGMVPLRYVLSSLAGVIWLAPLALNLVQSIAGMGPHRMPVEGEVVAVRSTILWYYEWIPSTRRSGAPRDRWCTQSDACYVAKVRGPDARTRKVALSEADKERVQPGMYLIADGMVQVFPDAKAAGRQR